MPGHAISHGGLWWGASTGPRNGNGSRQQSIGASSALLSRPTDIDRPYAPAAKSAAFLFILPSYRMAIVEPLSCTALTLLTLTPYANPHGLRDIRSIRLKRISDPNLNFCPVYGISCSIRIAINLTKLPCIQRRSRMSSSYASRPLHWRQAWRVGGRRWTEELVRTVRFNRGLVRRAQYTVG